MTSATLAPSVSQTGLDDDFAPLDVQIVIAEHAYGKLMCSTGDGWGSTCAPNSAAFKPLGHDPASSGLFRGGPGRGRARTTGPSRLSAVRKRADGFPSSG